MYATIDNRGRVALDYRGRVVPSIIYDATRISSYNLYMYKLETIRSRLIGY